MTPTRPGPPRHDPAWLACIPPRGQCASGEDHAHALDTSNERNVTSAARTGPISASDNTSRGQHRPDQDLCRRLSRPVAQHPKSEKPIGQHPWPAASCLGGYRTPAGARFPSHKATFDARFPLANFRHLFILHDIDRSTLGQLLVKLRLSFSFDEALTEQFASALKARNRLNHGFYERHNLAIQTDEGRDAMFANLSVLHDELFDAWRMADRISTAFLEAFLHARSEAINEPTPLRAAPRARPDPTAPPDRRLAVSA